MSFTDPYSKNTIAKPLGFTTLAQIYRALGYVPSRVLKNGSPGGGGGGFVVASGSPGNTTLDLSPAAQSRLNLIGFGFFVGGKLVSGELLGSAIYSSAVTFTNTSGSDIKSLIPAIASAVFTLKAVVLGVATGVATITFPSGSNTGTVAWSGGTYTLPLGGSLQLYAPSPADTNLAFVNGSINGLVA